MSYISSATTVAYVDARTIPKTVFLPSTFNIAGKLLSLKDIYGGATSNPITISTIGGDLFETGLPSLTINQAFGAINFVAQQGRWYVLGQNKVYADGASLSTISTTISYGLSSIRSDSGISSLSTIVSYGLSSLLGAVGSNTSPSEGLSSLSSIVSYGLSSLGGQTAPGISSLSSILSYALSSIFIDDHLRLYTYGTPYFHPSTLGGTGIQDAHTSNPDTYTNALGLIDYWLYKNIVDQPPAPTAAVGTAPNPLISISSIQVNWSNIFQFKVGILNVYAPLISTININVYSNTPQVINPQSNLLSTFVFSGQYIPFSPNNFTGFELNNGTSNNITLLSNLYFNNTTIKLAIPNTILNQANQPYSFDIYFANYSSNAFNILHFSNILLSAVNPPTAPFTFLSNMGFSNGYIYITAPLSNSDGGSDPSYPSLANYKVLLYNAGYQTRRYGVIPPYGYPTFCNTYIYPFSSNPQSNYLSNIGADLYWYTVTSAQNILNSNYGPTYTSASNYTQLPTSPGTLSNIFADPINPAFYTTIGQVVFNPSCNLLSIYKSSDLTGTGGLYFYTNSGLGVNSSNNPGRLGSGITNIVTFATTVNLGNTIREQNQIGLKGFYGQSFPYTSNVIGSNLFTNIITSNVNDFYPTDFYLSNFYMSFTGRVQLSNRFLVASSNYYTFNLTHSNSLYNTTINYGSNIWVDDLTAAPSVNGFSNVSNTGYLYISGVPVYNSSNTIGFNIDVNSLARYFFITGQNAFVATPLWGTAGLSGSCNANVSNAIFYTTNDGIQTVAPLSNITRVKFNYIFNNSNFYTPANLTSNINVQIALSNLIGTAATVTSNSGIYFDGLSQRILQIFLSNANAPGGARYESDQGSNANVPSIPYSNSLVIIGNSCNNYNIELPLVGGAFKTGAALASAFSNFNVYMGPDVGVGYTGLSNYSNISTEASTRFATFKYSFSNSFGAGVYIPRIFMTLVGGLGLTGSSTYPIGAVPYFQYRIDNVGSYNTGWLNANAVRSGITPFSGGVSNIAGLLSNTTSPLTSNSLYVSVPPIPPGCNFDIYVKIGLSNTCNLQFSYITQGLITNSLPPAVGVTGFNSSAATCNVTLTWVTPPSCNPPLDYYLWSIYACNTDPVYPRRIGNPYVVQEPYFLGNTCNNFSINSYSYSGLYSNFDTYYYGNILLANEVGQSVATQFGPIRTALPVLNGPFITDMSALLNTVPYFLYSNSAINFSYRVANGPVQQAQVGAVIFDMFYNGTPSNSFSLNTAPGPGISNYTLTATVTGDVNAGSVSSNLTSNLFLGSTGGSVASGSITLNLLNVADQYSSPAQAKGFYVNGYANFSAGFNSGSNSNIYSLSLTGIGGGTGTINSVVTWIDDVPPGAAFINSIQPDATQYSRPEYSNYVCGILTMTSNTVHPFFIEACNLGRYFFVSAPIIVSLYSNVGGTGTVISNFVFDNTNTKFYGSASVGSLYSIAPISNSTYFLWSNGLIGYNIYTPCNIGSFTGSASNLANSAGSAVGFVYGGSGKKFYYDTYSLVVVAATSNSNWSAGSYGARVESGSGLYPAIGTFGAPFNNFCNLTVGTYSNELQLAYGAYRTYCNAGTFNGYLDYGQFYNPIGTYLNYTGIGSNGFRYVTFAYSFPKGSSNYQSVDIGFIYGDAPPTFANGTGIFPGIQVYFKIVASNNTQALSNNYTTAWLDANSIAFSAPNSNSKNNEGLAAGINTIENLNDSSNLQVYYPILNYCNVNYTVYVRIGYPMNSNISLQYVTLTPSTGGFLPANLSNLSLSNSQTLGSGGSLLPTTMSWYRQNDGVVITNYYITTSALSSNVSGTIYPRRYLNTVINDFQTYNSNVNDPGATQLNPVYLFNPSNYDSYYYGTVFASNFSGRSINTLSNNSINLTPLPSNIGSDWGSGLNFSPSALASSYIYPQKGVSFATRSCNIYPIINASAPFQLEVYMYSNTNRITNLCVNPDKVGSGLANVTFNFYSGVLVFPSYTFNNGYYSYSNNTNTGYSNILSNTLYNSYVSYYNITDEYPNDIYRSNYYCTINPVIGFKNSSNNFTPRDQSYLIKMIYGSKNNSINVYVDSNRSLVPTGIISVKNDPGDINYTYICGVPVLTTSNFNFWITTSNIGYYFFNSNAVSASLSGSTTSNFSFNFVTTPFYSNTNINSSYTYATVSGEAILTPTYFFWSNIQVACNWAASFSLTGTLSNLSNATAISGSFVPYFDPVSIANLNCNVRVVAGACNYGVYPAVGSFGAPYDNTQPLTGGITSPYTYEMQFANGFYVNDYNNLSLYGYKQYYTQYLVPNGATATDYNTLKGYNACFLFSNIVTSNILNKINTMTITITYQSASSNIPTLAGTSFQYYNYATVQTRFNSNISLSNNDSSGWLNANTSNGLTNITIFNKNVDGNSGLTGSISRVGATDTLTIKVPDGCGYSNSSNNFYVRFTNTNDDQSIAFSQILYSSRTECNVPSQFYYNSNIANSGAVTVNYNVINGIPTYLYNTMSNFLWYSNSGTGTYNISCNTTVFTMNPLSNSYPVVNGLILGIGNYSNQTNIYLPNGTLLYSSNYLFTISGRAPTLLDFTVALYNNGTFSDYIIPTLTNTTFQPQPVVFYWNVTDNGGSGPSQVQPQTLQGPINSGSIGQIINDSCTYGHNFTFNIFASNSVGVSPTSNIAAYTGGQQSFGPPTLSRPSASTNNTTGGISYSFNYTGIAGYGAGWNVTAGGGTIDSGVTNSGGGTISGGPFAPPSRFFQYFATSVNMYMQNNSGGCYLASGTASTGTTTNDYSIVTPSLTVISILSNTTYFTITVDATNVPTPPSGVTLTTSWSISGGSTSIVSQTNSEVRFTAYNANTTYTIYAIYDMFDGVQHKTSAQGSTTATVGGFVPITGSIIRTVPILANVTVNVTTDPQGNPNAHITADNSVLTDTTQGGYLLKVPVNPVGQTIVGYQDIGDGNPNPTVSINISWST